MMADSGVAAAELEVEALQTKLVEQRNRLHF